MSNLEWIAIMGVFFMVVGILAIGKTLDHQTKILQRILDVMVDKNS